MKIASLLLFCVLCFYEIKSSTEESLEVLEVSSESIGDDSKDVFNESGSKISFEIQSEEESEDVSMDSSTEESLELSSVFIGDDSDEDVLSNESGSSTSFELQSDEGSEDVSDVSIDSTLTSTEESLELSSESIGDDSEDVSNESGSSISFELQSEDKSAEGSEDVSNVFDTSYPFSNGVINNDQVYCSWEDIDARDEMATKLGTELCRFSMVSLCNYQKFDQITWI